MPLLGGVGIFIEQILPGLSEYCAQRTALRVTDNRKVCTMIPSGTRNKSWGM